MRGGKEGQRENGYRKRRVGEIKKKEKVSRNKGAQRVERREGEFCQIWNKLLWSTCVWPPL